MIEPEFSPLAGGDHERELISQPAVVAGCVNAIEIWDRTAPRRRPGNYLKSLYANR